MRAVPSGISEEVRRDPSNGASMRVHGEADGFLALAGTCRRVASSSGSHVGDGASGMDCSFADLPPTERRASMSSGLARWLVCWGGILISVVGCRNVETNATASRGNVVLGSGAVATVGNDMVSSEVVAAVRDASSLTADRAVEQIIEARLLGKWAREGGLAAGRRNHVGRTLLARSLLEAVERKTRETPITDAEIDEATKRRWYEFERPEARRIAHVVVRFEGTREDAAMALARRIAKAVKGLREASSFLEAARAVPTESLKVVAETLPPALADGRVLALDSNGKPIGEGGTFDRDFVGAAFQLKDPGDQSGILRTAFGFHVLLFQERIDGLVVPLEERRKLLAPDVLKRRAQLRVDEWLDAGRKGLSPSVERAALEVTSRVKVSP